MGIRSSCISFPRSLPPSPVMSAAPTTWPALSSWSRWTRMPLPLPLPKKKLSLILLHLPPVRTEV